MFSCYSIEDFVHCILPVLGEEEYEETPSRVGGDLFAVINQSVKVSATKQKKMSALDQITGI